MPNRCPGNFVNVFSISSLKQGEYVYPLNIFQKFIFWVDINLLKYGSFAEAFLNGGDFIEIMNRHAPIENASAFSPLYLG